MSDTQDTAGRQPDQDEPDASEPVAPDQEPAAAVVPGPGFEPATGQSAGVQDPDEPEPDAQEPAGPVRLRLRRAPKYRAFGLTGVVAGVLIGLILAYSRAATGDYSQQTIAGYFAAAFGMVGAVIGLGIAVLTDRRRP